ENELNWAPSDHLLIYVLMKAYAMGATLAILLAGCGDSSSSATAKKPATTNSSATTNNSSGNPVTAPVDYLGAVAQAKKTSIKVADVASLKQAIEMFKQEEDRYPKDLTELVSKKYIPALPATPYQMKYQYNPATGEVKVVPAQGKSSSLTARAIWRLIFPKAQPSSNRRTIRVWPMKKGLSC